MLTFAIETTYRLSVCRHRGYGVDSYGDIRRQIMTTKLRQSFFDLVLFVDGRLSI